MYYPSSGNKEAAQLCSYCTAGNCTADQRLCFCIGKNPVLSIFDSINTARQKSKIFPHKRIESFGKRFGEISYILIPCFKPFQYLLEKKSTMQDVPECGAFEPDVAAHSACGVVSWCECLIVSLFFPTSVFGVVISF